MFDASLVRVAYSFLRARYYRNLGVQSLIKILLDGQNKKLHDVH